MPALRTVHDWREKDAEFAERFTRARDAGADAIADAVLEIADEMPHRAAGGGESRHSDT